MVVVLWCWWLGELDFGLMMAVGLGFGILVAGGVGVNGKSS